MQWGVRIRTLNLDDFGTWSPRVIYGMAMAGVVTVSLPIADPKTARPPVRGPRVELVRSRG